MYASMKGPIRANVPTPGIYFIRGFKNRVCSCNMVGIVAHTVGPTQEKNTMWLEREQFAPFGPRKLFLRPPKCMFNGAQHRHAPTCSARSCKKNLAICCPSCTLLQQLTCLTIRHAYDGILPVCKLSQTKQAIRDAKWTTEQHPLKTVIMLCNMSEMRSGRVCRVSYLSR